MVLGEICFTLHVKPVYAVRQPLLQAREPTPTKRDGSLGTIQIAYSDIGFIRTRLKGNPGVQRLMLDSARRLPSRIAYHTAGVPYVMALLLLGLKQGLEDLGKRLEPEDE